MVSVTPLPPCLSEQRFQFLEKRNQGAGEGEREKRERERRGWRPLSSPEQAQVACLRREGHRERDVTVKPEVRANLDLSSSPFGTLRRKRNGRSFLPHFLTLL